LVRPHSSLGYLTPMEYINKLRGVREGWTQLGEQVTTITF
jgi:hypothetical protein